MNLGNSGNKHIYKVYSNYNIYDLTDENFINFFEKILTTVPFEYTLMFAELVLEKNLEIPQILKNYLEELEPTKKNDSFKQKDSMDIDTNKNILNYSANYMRLLLKYRKTEETYKMITNLINNKNYLPTVELYLVTIFLIFSWLI